MSQLNPNDVVRTNSGYVKVNGIELLELEEAKVTITPNTKTMGIMNSASEGELTMSYKCKLTLKVKKVYSRFKPAILEAAKNLQNFTFDFEGTNYSADKKQEESLFISDCWINGETTLMQLGSNNDFAGETFEAGFLIENSDYVSVIDDGEDW